MARTELKSYRLENCTVRKLPYFQPFHFTSLLIFLPFPFYFTSFLLLFLFTSLLIFLPFPFYFTSFLLPFSFYFPSHFTSLLILLPFSFYFPSLLTFLLIFLPFSFYFPSHFTSLMSRKVLFVLLFCKTDLQKSDSQIQFYFPVFTFQQVCCF